MITARIDKGSMHAVNEAMKRAQKELNKTPKEALSLAGVSIIKSLGARTKVSKKKRPIVENPDQRYKTDMRIARFGVYKFKQGKQYFTPIFRGGEFGQRIKYLNRGSVLLKVGKEWIKFKNTEVRQFAEQSGNAKLDVRMTNHPKVKIGRSGLAKKSWGFMSRIVKAGGNVFAMGVNNVGSIKWSVANTRLTIFNHLKYVQDSIIGKQSTINSAIEAAGRQLDHRIDAAVAKAIAK